MRGKELFRSLAKREGCGVKGEVFNGPGSLALGGSGNPAEPVEGRVYSLTSE